MSAPGAGGAPPQRPPNPVIVEPALGGLASRLDPVLDAAEGVVAPAVSALVWRDGREVYARAPERVYDLASLTKPLCTAELAMRAVDAGVLALDAGHPLLPDGVTIRHLLQHAAGFPAWRPLWGAADRAGVYTAALATPLERAPGGGHTYSDIGFLALGAVLEAVGGARLDALAAGPLRWGDVRAEPTFCEERKAEVRGTVHDRNAAAMDGVAPHAGLFGTAREVAETVARWLRGDVPGAAEAFAARGPGTHALGWDTVNADSTSSAGPRPPAGAFGHLGYTGTAVWIAPETGLVAVLLTNRVWRTPDASPPGPAPIRELRRRFFQAVWDGASGEPG